MSFRQKAMSFRRKAMSFRRKASKGRCTYNCFLVKRHAPLIAFWKKDTPWVGCGLMFCGKRPPTRGRLWAPAWWSVPSHWRSVVGSQLVVSALALGVSCGLPVGKSVPSHRGSVVGSCLVVSALPLGVGCGLPVSCNQCCKVTMNKINN